MGISFNSSISATVSIRGNTYTLTGNINLPDTTPVLPGGASPAPIPLPAINLRYSASWPDAISLGTLANLASDTDSLIHDICTALNVATFEDDWKNLRANITSSVPPPFSVIFKDVFTNAELRITDLGLAMEAPKDGSGYKKGVVTLGFGFDCSHMAEADRKLLGILLQAVGVKVSINVALP